MSERYYTPWVGAEYPNTKTLIISESAYSWEGDDGEVYHPSPNHAVETVEECINELPTNRYVRQITRAICGKNDPSMIERRSAWAQYAYSIYIPDTVGIGPGGHRTPAMWAAGAQQFLSLINDFDVEKVVITGLTAWGMMPDCEVYLTDELQAYRRRNGRLTWCLAVPHPANRHQGFNWDGVSQQISLFRATSFPNVWPVT
jgi:hypothetical protein